MAGSWPELRPACSKPDGEIYTIQTVARGINNLVNSDAIRGAVNVGIYRDIGGELDQMDMEFGSGLQQALGHLLSIFAVKMRVMCTIKFCSLQLYK